MKKLLLSLAACSSLATSQAQLPKSVLLYGNLDFYSRKESPDNTKNINWMATPGIGYQFNDHCTVGLNLSWGQNAIHYDSGTVNVKITQNNYAAGPFFRYTDAIANSPIFFWYGQLNANYTGGYNTSGDVPSYNKHNGFDINIEPAIGANLGHHWSLEFAIGGLGYSHDADKDAGADESYNAMTFNFGQHMTFGISKHFGSHKMHNNREPMDETRDMDKSDDMDKKKKHKKDDDE